MALNEYWDPLLVYPLPQPKNFSKLSDILKAKSNVSEDVAFLLGEMDFWDARKIISMQLNSLVGLWQKFDNSEYESEYFRDFMKKIWFDEEHHDNIIKEFQKNGFYFPLNVK